MTDLTCRGCDYVDTGVDPRWEARVDKDDGLCEDCFSALAAWWRNTCGRHTELQATNKNYAKPVAVDEWLQAGAPGAWPSVWGHII